MYDDPQPKKRQRTKKRDITLMTLIAFESTTQARDLLKKHNQQPAKNYLELERKLGDLYMSTNDKATLERELAEIHPHKDWLFRTLPQMKVTPPASLDESGGTATTKLDDIKKEVASPSSGFDGNENRKYACSGLSSFDGSTVAKQIMSDPLHLIALVSVVGIIFYAIKHKN